MVTSKTVILNLKNVGLSDEQFYQLCQTNENWRLEQTAQGELLIMPPVGAISGNRESELNGYVWLWNLQTQLGKVFSSSTIFILPNGGKRSPDVAWIANDRWQALTPEEQEKFAPICPDFVIELRSRRSRGAARFQFQVSTNNNKLNDYLHYFRNITDNNKPRKYDILTSQKRYSLILYESLTKHFLSYAPKYSSRYLMFFPH